MVCLYVDDLIVTGDDTDEIRSVRDQLSRSPSLCYIPALLVTGFWCGDRPRFLVLASGKEPGNRASDCNQQVQSGTSCEPSSLPDVSTGCSMPCLIFASRQDPHETFLFVLVSVRVLLACQD